MTCDVRRLGGKVDEPEAVGALYHLVPRTPTPGPGRLERRALCGLMPGPRFTTWGEPEAHAPTCEQCRYLEDPTRPWRELAAFVKAWRRHAISRMPSRPRGSNA